MAISLGKQADVRFHRNKNDRFVSMVGCFRVRIFPQCPERAHWQWMEQTGAKLMKSSLLMKPLMGREIVQGIHLEK